MMLAHRSRPPQEAKRPDSLPAKSPSRPHGGRSLDPTTLGLMQSRFRQDFSAVRIHTDDAAARSAAALGAKAYSNGTDLIFAHGRYAPDSLDGKRLLAHELAHVTQQRQPTHSAAGSSEARAEAAAQEVLRGQDVNVDALGGAAPGIHCDGEGKEEKKDETASIDAKPVFVPLSMLPLPKLQPPSLLSPPQRTPLIPVPQFGGAPTAGGSGFGTGSSPAPRLLPPLSGTPGTGPLAPTVPPFMQPPPSATGSGGPAPDLPSRVGLTNVGPFSIGLRLGMPGPAQPVAGTPPERRPQGPFQIPGSGPSPLSIGEYRAELLNMSITGKVPSGFEAIDKGELAKVVFSIASTYIAPDFFKSLASKVAGKPGPDIQIDLALNGDFKGGGIVFTMPLGKPKIIQSPSTP